MLTVAGHTLPRAHDQKSEKKTQSRKPSSSRGSDSEPDVAVTITATAPTKEKLPFVAQVSGDHSQQRRRPHTSRPSNNNLGSRLSPLRIGHQINSYGVPHLTAPRPEDILAAHDTWRTIDFSGADVPPIRAVSSESLCSSKLCRTC